jgi:hypothetical protein
MKQSRRFLGGGARAGRDDSANLSSRPAHMNPRGAPSLASARRGRPPPTSGPPASLSKLRAAVARELKPNGAVQTFLVDRVADALSEFDDAEPSNALMRDPLAKTQSEVLDGLYSALRELASLQARRRRRR